MIIHLGHPSIPPADHDLVILGDDINAPRYRCTSIVGSDDEILIGLRQVFCQHHHIARLANCRLVCHDDSLVHRVPAIERRLCDFLGDIGNTPLDAWVGARNLLKSAPTWAKGASSATLTGIHRGLPALCLGAGPSLTGAIDAIRRLQSGCLIFACDAVAQGLIAAGIKPDYITLVERGPEQKAMVLPAVDAHLIGSPFIAPDILAAYEGKTVLMPSAAGIREWHHPHLGPVNGGRSSGTMTLQAALTAGCDPIYLVGHDCSYEEESHATVACDLAKVSHRDGLAIGQESSVEITLSGYDGKPRRSNRFFSSCATELDCLAHGCERKVYNDPSGALIPSIPVGALPAELPDIGQRKFVRPESDTKLSPMNGATAQLREQLDAAIKVAEKICEKVKAARFADQLPALNKKLHISSLFNGQWKHLMTFLLRELHHGLLLRVELRSGAHNPDIQQFHLNLLAISTLATMRKIRSELA